MTDLAKRALRISGVAFLATGALIDFPGRHWWIAFAVVGVVLSVDCAIQLSRALERESA